MKYRHASVHKSSSPLARTSLQPTWRWRHSQRERRWDREGHRRKWAWRPGQGKGRWWTLLGRHRPNLSLEGVRTAGPRAQRTGPESTNIRVGHNNKGEQAPRTDDQTRQAARPALRLACTWVAVCAVGLWQMLPAACSSACLYHCSSLLCCLAAKALAACGKASAGVDT